MSRRILIVEDSRTQAERLKAVLEGAGYAVGVAADGEAGLAALTAQPPDAVISDIVMPGSVDGYELCRRIKAGPHRDVPVVLLTSLSDPADIIRALECGADNFLRKPYDPKYLLERLRTVFTTRELRARGTPQAGLRVLFMGREVTVNADHQQVLDLLMSTFEEAVLQNRELRQREEELRAAKEQLDRYAGALEQRLKSVLETIPDALFSVDPSLGNLFYISPAVERVFGYTPDEMLRDPQLWRRNVHPDDLASVLNTFSGAVESGTAQRVECRFRLRDGAWRWIQVNVAAVSDADRGLVRLDGVAHDITQRKLAEDVIRQLNEGLERRVAERTSELTAVNQELESFSYSVSHDLRAPLRAINGFGQILEEECGERLDAGAREHLQRIRTATLRMSALIDDLIELARVTRTEMRRAPVDLSAMARDVAAGLQAVQPGRGVEVVVAHGLCATGDCTLLRQVLENLFGNAWKFTSRHERARIEFGAEVVDGKQAFFVRDDGAGFDPKYADRLFGAFQRLHKSSDFEGTGIGLATVQRIVRRHGGRAWARSAVEQGATFYFTLD